MFIGNIVNIVQHSHLYNSFLLIRHNKWLSRDKTMTKLLHIIVPFSKSKSHKKCTQI
jgi:hypothetical protein